MHTITLYGKPNCPLCDHTRYYLRGLLAARPDPGAWTLEEISILDDQDLYAAYRYRIPVVVVDDGAPLEAPAAMDSAQLARALNAAAAPAPAAPQPPLPPAEAPAPQVAAGPPVYPYPVRPARPPAGILGALERFGNGMGDHWLAGANTAVGVFSGLPWLAPIFAKLGWWFLADPIYTIYMFFCHQLPERAGTLFGYQVAYCYRNSAIYTTIFLTGLLYGVARRGGLGGRLAWMRTPLRWQVFVLLLIPIGVDGLSHLLGLREDNAWFDSLTGGIFGSFSVGDALGTLNWWLRVITGALFGFAVVRLVYPWIQVVVEESRRPVWPGRPLTPSLQQGRPAVP